MRSRRLKQTALTFGVQVAIWIAAIRWQWTSLLPVFYLGALAAGFVGYFLAWGGWGSSGERTVWLIFSSFAATIGASILILLICLFLGFPLHP